jgi:hypothetical protein
MIEEEEKEEKQGENNILLHKEIESWKKHFGYALREVNRILFNKLLSEYHIKEEYTKAVNSKEENYSTESLLFMTLIFQQQKIISQ